MAKISAKNARFKVGSNNIAAQRMTFTPRTQLVDATSTEGSGYEEWVSGISGADFSADIVYDPAVGPFALMTPGTSYTVEFYPVLATTGSKLSGTAFVETHEMTGEVRGLVTARISGKYTGTVTISSM